MESEVAEKQASYTYWVREAKEDAAPIPPPRKLSADDISKQSQPATLGSVWNQAGTWEEKNLNTWASNRIKELLGAMASLEFSCGKADIAEVSRCSGDFNLCYDLQCDNDFDNIGCMDLLRAFLVTVRNKKRVGYTYELTLKFKGEWLIKEKTKKIKGHIDILEFSFGELDDLQMEVRLSEEKDIIEADKQRISKDIRLFLQPIREKLVQFEQELKDR